MISTLQQSSKFPNANADYAGFSAFNMWQYLSGPTTPTAPSYAGNDGKQFLGEIQQVGLYTQSIILDASIGVT